MYRKLRSQKMNLFIYYAFLITLLLSIGFFIFYLYYQKSIYTDAEIHASNLCASVNSSVDSELHQMSTISMNTAYSTIIKKNLSNLHTNTPLHQNPSFLSSRDSILDIYDTISAIIGPFQSVTQINLYSLTGTFIGSGFYQYTEPISLSQKSWYKDTLEKNGSKYITSPKYLSDVPHLNINLKGHKFISLCRIFFDDANTPQGIVEVMQDCDTIFSFTKEVLEVNPTLFIYIYNDRGEVVFPYETAHTPPLSYHNLIIEKNLIPLKSYPFTSQATDSFMLTYSSIPEFDWKVIVIQPKNHLLAPLHIFTKYFMLVTFFAILLTLLLCFFVASRLTSPLHKLTLAIKQVNINTVLEKNTSIIPCPDSSIEEIHTLFNSFNSMYHKLCLSSQEILTAKSEETRAKMLATQSMINPHFLYNNLANISILAEEKMTDEIIFMCHALCDYLRYITTANEMPTSLETEILYTEKYIRCMQIRFGNDFNYTICIPDPLKCIAIPKLIIQPLVENSFKYGFNTSPPWQLSITGEIKEGNWLIHIEDNGIGMTKEILSVLSQTLEDVRKNREIATLKIGGMGLRNVYLRLLLLYNEAAIFEIQSTYTQGTRLTIGGPILTRRDYNESPNEL